MATDIALPLWPLDVCCIHALSVHQEVSLGAPRFSVASGAGKEGSCEQEEGTYV
jgi:hypothetical protein